MALAGFTNNIINGPGISPDNVSWVLQLDGPLTFPANRITQPQLMTANALTAIRNSGQNNGYEPEESTDYPGNFLDLPTNKQTNVGPSEISLEVGFI